MNFKSKELIVSIITAVVGTLFWWLLKLYFFSGTIPIWILAMGVVLFLASTAIFLILSSSNKIIFFLPTVLALGFLMFFGLNKITGIALIIFGLLFIVGVNSARFYQKQFLQIRVGYLSKKVLPKIFLGVSVLVAVVFYLSPEGVIFEGNQAKIPESFYNSTIKIAEPIIKNFLPEFSFNMTAEDFIISTSVLNIEKGLGGESLPPELLKEFSRRGVNVEEALKDPQARALLRAEVKKEIEKSDVLDKQLSDFSKKYGVEIKSEQKISDIFYSVLNQKVSVIFAESPERKDIFRGLLAVGLFLALFGIRFLFVFVSRILVVGIFAVLREIGIVKIEIEKVDKEIIKL